MSAFPESYIDILVSAKIRLRWFKELNQCSPEGDEIPQPLLNAQVAGSHLSFEETLGAPDLPTRK